MIDTHAHIYAKDFKEDLPEIIDRATQNGLSHILMPNIDVESIDEMLEVEDKYPNCIAMMGLHPCYVKKDFEQQLYQVEDWLSKRPFVAVGEIGTDLYWDDTFWEQQKEAFNIQCELAIKHQLPVAIHCRDSIDENIALVEPFAENGLKGVFHCFTGTAEQAKRITDMGFYLGLGGVVTFKNGGMKEVVPMLDQNYLVLETDSPYLTPTPHRGKRNEPYYTTLVAQKVAELLGKTIEEVDTFTTKNALDLFNHSNHLGI